MTDSEKDLATVREIFSKYDSVECMQLLSECADIVLRKSGKDREEWMFPRQGVYFKYVRGNNDGYGNALFICEDKG